MSTDPTNSANKASWKILNRELGQYSLAAAIAGVSMLALADPAAAEVVVTRKTIPIPMGHVGMPLPVKVSMANNGVDNFLFSLGSYQSSLRVDRGLGVGGESPTDGVLGTSLFYGNASALVRGAKIGPTDGGTHFFGQFIGLMAASTSRSGIRSLRGNWARLHKSHYLGVRFQINGENHYGWIRLTVTTNPQVGGPVMTATISGYAYETIANKPISAGTAASAMSEGQVLGEIQGREGASLGMLALGADGLPLWRREEGRVRQ